MSSRFVPKGVAYVPVAAGRPQQHIVFLLLSNFSLLAFSSAIEPLRIANQLSGQALFTWVVISADGQSAQCSNGTRIEVEGGLGDCPPGSMFFVCGGVEPDKSATKQVGDWLRLQWRTGRTIGGLCTGAYSLARAGILEGRKFTLHWENLAPFIEQFDHLDPVEQLYCIDGRIMTCGGGAAATDLFVEIVQMLFGEDLASSVLSMCLHGHHRPATLQQKTSVAALIGTRHPLLSEVIRYLQRNIEPVLELRTLADSLGISSRQIQRLFRRYLGTTPKQYHTSLRLERGRALLSETDMGVSEIAFACGFANASTFARAFRIKYGVSPNRFSTCGVDSGH